MEKHIKARWNDDLLATAAARCGVAISDLTVLDGFESFIYEFERDGQGVILRVSHSLRRSENLIRGEVDWLNHLSKGGAFVAEALAFDNGQLVEVIPDNQGDSFLATLFRKAPGKHTGWDDWTPEFVQHYGETIGKIHHLSKGYQPSNPEWRRYEWDDPISLELESWAKIVEADILTKAHEVVARLKALPQDETYHMIHQDAHGGNFFVDDAGKITLFDFDDCVYSHAINDIAMVFFYYSPMWDNPDKAKTFAQDFLTGYARQNRLSADWLEHLHDFMKLREFDLYAMIERDVDWRNGEDAWAANFMQGRRERLLNDVPIVAYDFTELANLMA